MLRGEHVELTEIRPEDKEALFRWINDAETVRFNAAYRPVDWESHCRWFDELGRSPSRVIFAIRLREQPAIVGTVQLVDVHPVHRSAELIIRIGSATDRGKGFGTEAVKLATNFAFDDLNLVRVWLRVFATNARAIGAYKKAGLAEEGTMRKAVFSQGQWLDEIIMAVVR
ncbi:MAG: GNAT family N-acetyltransferase [Cupriavidus sp.]|nr:GNAT family N-acetyltransferase [Cupriavidus sp.]